MMSTHFEHLRGRCRAGRDTGMTLPEVLITMVIMGTLMTALVAATTVVLREQDNSQGRLNNARSEQNVGIWLPSDLASAEDVDTTPGASPCGSACPAGINVGGSNALMLTWTGTVAGATDAIPTVTTVSYRYVEVGAEFQIIRVACISVGGGAPTCNQVAVLHNVSPPPPGQSWIPGTTSPVWVFVVRLALDPALADAGPDDTAPANPAYYTKNGRRVTVTINGGGDVAGAGGGLDNITLSAGGTDRKPNLSTSNFSDPPSFGATRSRCGGNFAMLVDTSGSIGSTNMASVRTGITAFIDSFAGTPIKLEVVPFSTKATTFGAGTGWARYYDMLVDADVAELKADVATLTSGGWTNWEDAMFRVFKNSDGTVQPTLPDTLIFFTDGMPTYNRLLASSSPAPAVADIDDAGLPAAGSGSFNQVSWNRAWRIARDYYADVDRFIGVFVGTDTAGTSLWRGQGAGYHLEGFQRGSHATWEQGYHLENLQRGYHLQYQRASSNVKYQKYKSGSWSSTDWTSYAKSNKDNTTTDNYRTVVASGKTPGVWTEMTTVNGKLPETLYAQSNIDATDADGYRIAKVYSAPYDVYEPTDEATFLANNTPPTINAGWSGTAVNVAPFNYWALVAQAQYDTNNTTPDELDGWRTSIVGTPPYSAWEPTTEALYTSNNTTADNSDGWDATKVYGQPYTFHEGAVSYYRPNTEILGQIVSEGATVPAVPTGGPYTNAAVADLYVLPNWNQFAGALNAMALAECGGTVTVQTRVGTAAAADPFTYQNSVDLTTATTSSLYRSGTFDFVLSGGVSVVADITPLNVSGLANYAPVSWACKASGADYPFTVTPIAGSPWPKITLTVSPNQAISCVQTVRLL